jgi:hypothetical protein
MKITFNGTTANYSTRYVYGNGATVSSTTGSSTDIRGYASLDLSTDTASTFSSDELYIPSYTVAQNKPVSLSESTENNGTTAYIFAGAGLWQNTGAITSITLTANSGNIVTSSSFYLYGIKNS